MLNFFKNVDRAADKTSRVAFNAASTMAKFALKEFKEHPIATPIALLGAGLTVVEAYSVSTNWDRYKQRETDITMMRNHLAETAVAERVELTIPENVQNER